MSPYAEEEKKKALYEQNRAINESRDLKVVEFRHTRIPFYLFLIVFGLLLLGIGILIHS